FAADALVAALGALGEEARLHVGGDEADPRVAALAGRLLEGQRAASPGPTRPGTAVRHRRLADQVREALAEAADLGLGDVARITGVSVYHLSRTFRAVTGLTLSRYRIRLRARQALERLAEGERDLAGLAADLGFSDQAHLTRTLRLETNVTPGRLRNLWGCENPIR
ncbi:MAG: helix-turn-helix domain-containing protein, partial [Actinomycetota bacterium]